MMVFAVVVMVTAPVIMVMGAALGFVHQPAIEIPGGKRLHRGSRFASTNRDALLRKQRDGSLSNAAHDDDVCALLAQPAREKSRRVRRRCHRLDADDLPLFGVSLHEREFAAAAKVSV